MQIVDIQKWLFTMLLIFPVMSICSRPMQRNSIKNNNDYECRRSFDNILTDLRNNWQSPISYLQTRGYIPQNRERTYNINFRTRDERVKGDVGKSDSSQKVTSSFNRGNLNKDVSSNGANNNINNLNTNADNTPNNNLNTNVDTSSNTNNLNSNLHTNLHTNSLNNNLNTNLNTNLNSHLNTNLRTNLNLNSELNTNHKMDTFPTANSIARLNAETMSNANPIINLNSSPNLINELNTNTNLNSYADLNNDLNQPSAVQSSAKTEAKNANFLHNVKNKFLGFFRNKSDSKEVGNKKSSAFTYDIYNDFSDSLPKELVLPDNKLQDISKLYGKASDPEIERIIQRGLKKDNEYDKEFISSSANKELLSRLGKYT